MEPLIQSKVYWIGRHCSLKTDTNSAWFSPLGKFYPAILKFLKEKGWKQIDLDVNEIPIFSFMTRKSGDFSLQSPFPKIRQLPQNISDLLDDKILLHKYLSGFEKILPITFIYWSDFLDYYKEEAKKEKNLRFFVKHKWGVKGKSVYPLTDIEKIKDIFKEGQHVIQKEVPPFLLNERKFVIRSHILVTSNPFAIYVHKTCIILEHEFKYNAEDNRKAVHVSSAGKNNPTPYLLNELEEKFYLEIFSQIIEIGKITLSKLQGKLIHDPNIYLYQLFGYDFLVDEKKNVILLEINSYPAIGNGTMAEVKKDVFTEVMLDLLKIVVFPITELNKKELGNFVELRILNIENLEFDVSKLIKN